MDFSLSKKHLLSQALYRSFAENEVKPLAQDIDEKEDFPRETVGKMARCGMMGIPVPEEYGARAATPCPISCVWRNWQRCAAPHL